MALEGLPLETEAILRENGYHWLSVGPDNHWYGISEGFLFTTAIIGGPIKDAEHSYTKRWCYQTKQQALDAYVGWIRRGYEGEPVGWVANKSVGAKYEHPEDDLEYGKDA